MYFKISFAGITVQDGFNLLINLIREDVYHLSVSLLCQLLEIAESDFDDGWLYVPLTKEIVRELDYEDFIEDDYFFIRSAYEVFNLDFEIAGTDIFIH